jgi:Zn-dependent M32 family carboxypeptidase
MDKATATAFVERIEAHREREEAIWQEMRDRPDYEMHEDKMVKGIIDARKSARALVDEANSDLASFDWVEDSEGDLVPIEDGLPA